MINVDNEMYEKQVKLLRYCAKADCTECAVAGCPGPQRFLMEAADTIEKLIEVIQNHDFLESLIKPCWIPVTKAPALKVGDEGYPGYLVYANGYYDVADYAIDRLGNGPSFHVDGEYEPDITHYMPLPKPPKEEKT